MSLVPQHQLDKLKSSNTSQSILHRSDLDPHENAKNVHSESERESVHDVLDEILKNVPLRNVEKK